MEELKKKYRRLRIPPLIHSQGQKDGLLDMRTVALLQAGFNIENISPLAILLPDSDASYMDNKWKKGNKETFRHPKNNWRLFCDAIRKKDEADKRCEHNDRCRAESIDGNDYTDAKAYVCPYGMIDFAVPVFIENRIVGVIFTGQRRPKAGTMWNPEMIGENGWFRPLKTDEEGIDIFQHCNKLTDNAIAAYIPESETKLRIDIENDLEDESRVVSPESVSQYIERFKEIGEVLSELATKAIKADKTKIADHYRQEIQRLFRPLLNDPNFGTEFYDRLVKIIGEIADIYDFEYFIMFSRHREEKKVECLCSFGLDKVKEYISGQWGKIWEESKESEENIKKVFSETPHSEFYDISRFSGISFMSPLMKIYGSKPDSKVFALSMPHSGHHDVIMIIGNRGREFAEGQFLPFDLRSFTNIAWEIPRMSAAVYLINQIKETSRRETQILFEMAHDLRNPIAAIVLRTQKIRRCVSVSQEDAKELQSLSAMAQRLNMISDRVWTVNDLESGRYQLTITPVSIGEVVHSCIKTFKEKADSRNIIISIDAGSSGKKGTYFFDKWPHLRTDLKLVSLAFINLLDNAVKYSGSDSEIRIDGEETPNELRISIVNLGLPIYNDEIEAIFKRGYRTKMAMSRVQEGVGLGLHLVKTIMNRIGGKMSVKSTEAEGKRGLHVIEFKLTFQREV